MSRTYTRHAYEHGDGYFVTEVYRRRKYASVAIDLICADITWTDAAFAPLHAAVAEVVESWSWFSPAPGSSYTHIDRVPIDAAAELERRFVEVVTTPGMVEPQDTYRNRRRST